MIKFGLDLSKVLRNPDRVRIQPVFNASKKRGQENLLGGKIIVSKLFF
jgi:hypothetical protein